MPETATQTDLAAYDPEPFSTEEHNALWRALHERSNRWADGIGSMESQPGRLYDYLHDTPRTSLVCEVIDTLHNLGYDITPR